MRRIRVSWKWFCTKKNKQWNHRFQHEFKARSVKKRSVDLSISIDGVKVTLCKSNRVKIRLNFFIEQNLLIRFKDFIFRTKSNYSHAKSDLSVGNHSKLILSFDFSTFSLAFSTFHTIVKIFKSLVSSLVTIRAIHFVVMFSKLTKK